uniref:Major facilitator superfamily (MFS) profile domain-containing protein n=1 Tax=Octactis speculum TaxID=3111310 RepID=A0A7S2ANW4_9STRA
MIFLADSMANSVVSPLVPFMVQHFFKFPVELEDRIGYFAGLLAAAYPTGHLISSSLWGVLVKRWGRRRILFICITGTMCAQMSLGLSTTFLGALAARFFQGLCSGATTVAKSYIAEISDNSTEATVFMALGVVFITGTVIGSFLGGLLSCPMGNEPLFSLGSWSPFFLARPFLLPVIVTSGHSALSLLTLFTINGTPRFKNNITYESIGMSRVSDSEGERVDAYSDLYGDLGPGNRSEDDRVNQARAYSDLFMMSESDVSDTFTSGDEARAGRSDNSRSSGNSRSGRGGRRDKNPNTPHRTFSSSERLADRAGNSSSAIHVNMSTRMQQQIAQKIELQKHRMHTLRVTAVIYWIYCAVYSSFNEVFAIWARNSKSSGGLSFTVFGIGMIQATAGLWTILSFTVLYPVVGQVCTAVGSLRLGLVLSLLFAYPIPIILSFLEWSGDNTPTWLALFLALGVNAVGVEFGFASVNGLLETCLHGISKFDSECSPHLRTILNNTALAFGPFISASLFAASMRSSYLPRSLLEGRLCLWTLVSLVLVNLLITLALPQWPWNSEKQVTTRSNGKTKQIEMI